MFKRSFIATGMAALMVIGSGNAALAFGPSGDGFGGGGFGGFGSGIESSFQGGGSFGGAEMQEARPVDENGKAVLADGEELREPAEQLTGERPELPEDVQNGERPELPEGIQNNERPEGGQMQDERPVDENGKAILADGEELKEPAEQLTGERPELPENIQNGERPELPEDIQNGERPELPEGAESEMTEKGPGIDLMKRMRSFPPKMQEETEGAAAEA